MPGRRPHLHRPRRDVPRRRHLPARLGARRARRELVIERPAHTAFVAEWYRLRGDRIASIRLVLDTAPLTRPRTRAAELMEVDPVCQMRVARDSAAATRAHRGTTYYFCNEGCAVAFEREPDRFAPSTTDAAT